MVNEHGLVSVFDFDLVLLHEVVQVADFSSFQVERGLRRDVEVNVVDPVGPLRAIISQHYGALNLLLELVASSAGIFGIDKALLHDVVNRLLAHHLKAHVAVHENVFLVLTDGCLIAGPQCEFEFLDVDLEKI